MLECWCEFQLNILINTLNFQAFFIYTLFLHESKRGAKIKGIKVSSIKPEIKGFQKSNQNGLHTKYYNSKQYKCQTLIFYAIIISGITKKQVYD